MENKQNAMPTIVVALLAMVIAWGFILISVVRLADYTRDRDEFRKVQIKKLNTAQKEIKEDIHLLRESHE